MDINQIFGMLFSLFFIATAFLTTFFQWKSEEVEERAIFVKACDNICGIVPGVLALTMGLLCLNDTLERCIHLLFMISIGYISLLCITLAGKLDDHYDWNIFDDEVV